MTKFLWFIVLGTSGHSSFRGINFCFSNEKSAFLIFKFLGNNFSENVEGSISKFKRVATDFFNLVN